MGNYISEHSVYSVRCNMRALALKNWYPSCISYCQTEVLSRVVVEVAVLAEVSC